MSFFGLTAFGPENYIKSSSISTNGFTLFSDEEFIAGFEKTTNFKRTYPKLNMCDIKYFLNTTFGFTPLDEEVEFLIMHSGKTLDDSISIEEILEILKNIREELGNQVSKGIKYTSFQKYYEDTYKHKRKEISPNETFKSPVTYSQNYGFFKFSERDLNYTHYPKVKCPETKYAEYMVKSGKQFMK